MLPRLALSPAFRASLTRARPSRPFRAAKFPPRFAVQISNRDHPILHLFLRQPPLASGEQQNLKAWNAPVIAPVMDPLEQ